MVVGGWIGDKRHRTITLGLRAQEWTCCTHRAPPAATWADETIVCSHAGPVYPPLACMGEGGQPAVHGDFNRHMEAVVDVVMEVVEGLM